MAAIRLAIAGCGLAGKRHIATIQNYQKYHHQDQIQLVALVDSDSAKQGLAGENIPWFSSLSAMFESPCRPDGVILATPNNMHVEDGLECIKNQCPVLIEKPIAVSVSEARQLVDASKKAQIPILVGHHRRHHPLIQKAKEMIDDNLLGVIRAISATCWLYKPDDYFDEAEWRTKKGAGPVFVNLIHDIDLIRYLCGDIVSVYAQKSPSLRGHENEDIASAILQLENEALCTISVSDTIASPWSWELTAGENPIYPKTDQSCYMIGGVEASLSVPDLSLWQHQGEKSWWSPIDKTKMTTIDSDPFINQLKQFINVIKGEEDPLISGEEATKSLQAVEAMLQSIAKKENCVFMMMEKAYVILADWGTSSLRLWVADKTGNILHQQSNQSGMSTLEPDQYEQVLDELLLLDGVGDLVPVVISGMAGAKHGWHEAPYVQTPASLFDIDKFAVKVPNCRRDIYILPGIAQYDKNNPNVMRGEETQLLGAASQSHNITMACMPGTHSKWVNIDDGHVTSFHTFMTGEVFQSLLNLPTLKPFMQQSNDNNSDKIFKKALAKSYHEPDKILSDLFSIRSSILLGIKSDKNMFHQLSGLVMGLEMRAMKDIIHNHKITLLADGDLADKYQQAFKSLSINYDLINSKEIAIAGLFYVARKILKSC